MANLALLAGDNIGYLQQALHLLAQLSDADYVRPGAAYGSGIGAHLRHCLDHYTQFFGGLAEGRIDYDARAREPRLETERAAAVEALRGLVARLTELGAQGRDRPLLVKMDCGDSSDPAGWWADSTVCRELQFLISHTVHHFALIGFILKSNGRPLPADFGIAPSTVRYNRAQASCAR